jgi:hypothetical protein
MALGLSRSCGRDLRKAIAVAVTVSVSTEETENTGQGQHGGTETHGELPAVGFERELRSETQAPLAPEAFVFLISTRAPRRPQGRRRRNASPQPWRLCALCPRSFFRIRVSPCPRASVLILSRVLRPSDPKCRFGVYSLGASARSARDRFSAYVCLRAPVPPC